MISSQPYRAARYRLVVFSLKNQLGFSKLKIRIYADHFIFSLAVKGHLLTSGVLVFNIVFRIASLYLVLNSK